ncbi:hypothetical protein ASC94_24330 [Massilia sp. Root418]|uniref:hypothetical protein n=1 Tax=Massilia sp. Root418 TaxID=1736532 RepID=UPI0007016B06|nr:hypothetical protein [Massilia sp. Root418]KQW88543.1 hypothetical protein ASC94_24330 [Massilia sp. Root418]
MKTLKLIAALAVLTTTSAFAADAPKADAPADAKPAPVLLASAATPAAAGAAGAAVAAVAAAPKKDAGRSRADVRREAVEAVRNHESTLSQDLSFYTK